MHAILERALQEKRVEIHRTDSLRYREQLEKEERIMERVLEKLHADAGLSAVGVLKHPGSLMGGSIMRLDQYLEQRHIPFTRLRHAPAYTANRVAQTLHVKGRNMAKTVLLRAGDGYALAVLPATHRVNMSQIRADLGTDDVMLATEDEMQRLFPDCERGAMPPFGSLYDVPTIVDESLGAARDIVFEAQDHEEAIRMSCHDYMEAEHPRLGHFASRS